MPQKNVGWRRQVQPNHQLFESADKHALMGEAPETLEYIQN
jgi:hypothetical protein